MNDKLTASEAVYGFAAWLTTRSEITKMGADEDCAPIAQLVGEFCKENNVTKLKIRTEPKKEKTDYGEKLQCMVECNDSAKSVKKWSINNTSKNILIDEFGSETAEWIDKEIEV